MNGNSGNITTEELGRRRYFALTQVLQNKVEEVIGKGGKAPFNMTIQGTGGTVLVADETVRELRGEISWKPNVEDVQAEFVNHSVVSICLKSEDDGQEFTFSSINLDEVSQPSGNAAPSTETRKPAAHAAGATD